MKGPSVRVLAGPVLNRGAAPLPHGLTRPRREAGGRCLCPLQTGYGAGRFSQGLLGASASVPP